MNFNDDYTTSSTESVESCKTKITNNFTAPLSSAYTDAKWDGTRRNCLYEGNQTEQCRLWSKGGVLGGTPKWKSNAGFRFNTTLDNGAYLWASLSGRYVGTVPIDRADSPTQTVRVRPAYSLYNGSMGLSIGEWDIQLWMQNLNNKRAEVSGQEGGIMGPRVIYSTPRTIGTNITYSFR